MMHTEERRIKDGNACELKLAVYVVNCEFVIELILIDSMHQFGPAFFT